MKAFVDILLLIGIGWSPGVLGGLVVDKSSGSTTPSDFAV